MSGCLSTNEYESAETVPDVSNLSSKSLEPSIADRLITINGPQQNSELTVVKIEPQVMAADSLSQASEDEKNNLIGGTDDVNLRDEITETRLLSMTTEGKEDRFTELREIIQNNANTVEPEALSQDQHDDVPNSRNFLVDPEEPSSLKHNLQNESGLYKEYRLKRGDNIKISVFNEPDMGRTVSVLPDGNINYTLVGNVKALNKTFDELATDITVRLREFFIDPIVSINPETLSRGAKHHVVIRGAVRYPGRYEIETGDRIIEMIAATEGLLFAKDNTILADFARSGLYRDGERLPLDFEKLLKNEDFSDNILLRDGDLIYLPPRSLTRSETIGFVSVMGAVNTIGAISIGADDTVLDVFIKAGGAAEEANWKNAYLYRDGEYVDIDLESMLKERDLTNNIIVKDGDFIYVPGGHDLVTIIGAVSNSGKYAIGHGDRILDMIAKAGGLLFRPDFNSEVLANLNASYIFRNDEMLDIDFQALVQEGAMEYNILVEDRDFIYIPEATSQQVYVFGEVTFPQAIPITRKMSLVEVLARTGDLTDIGKFTGQAAIFRGGMLDERDVILKDLKKLFKGDLTQNIMLEDGDIIYIPEVRISKFGRFTGFITTWLEFITDVYEFQFTTRRGKKAF